MNSAVFVQKDRTLPGHGYQHIQSAHFPELFTVINRLFFVSNGRPEYFSQFMMVRFYEKRVVFQHIHQQILFRIHHYFHPFSLLSLHNPLIHIPGKGIGNTAG